MGDNTIMTIPCLTFTNLTYANTAQEEMWYNKIMATATNNHQLVGDCITHYFLSDLQAMTKAQVILLKIYSVKTSTDEETDETSFVINHVEGGSDRFTDVKEQANNPGNYWFVKDTALMTNVVNYSDENYDIVWNPDDEVI